MMTIQFCTEVIEACEKNPGWHKHIVFSDESTFYLTGVVNRHNCNYYNLQNPHLREVEKLKSLGITVWAAVTFSGVLSFDISVHTMNAERYCQVLRDHIIPHFDVPEMKEALYQHDGAPAHYSNAARQILDNLLPGRWIGRRGPMEWPPRSPDLSVCDFFLWGFLKEKVYSNNLATEQQLLLTIENELCNIPKEFLNKSYDEFLTRCYRCIAVDGMQFE